MSWMNAYLRGLVVFVYFFAATVLLPNVVLRLESVGSMSSFLQDAIVLVIWGAGLVAGMYLLRRFQTKGIV